MAVRSCAFVTSGAGFLGSHVCKRLGAQRKRVIAPDNLMTGRRQDAAHLLACSDFSLIDADLCNEPPKIFVDETWDLAGPASPTRDQNPRRRRPDIDRAVAVVGRRPGVFLTEGLKRSIADFEGALASPHVRAGEVAG